MQDFDPLKFLGIKSIPEKQKQPLVSSLMLQINLYLVSRFLENLADKELEHIDNPAEFLLSLQNKIPDFSIRMKQYLEDFKKEFNRRIVND